MDTDNNMMPASVSGSTPSSVSVSLYIQTDNWAEETSWELLDENGNTVDSGNGLANNTNYEYDWNLSYGCYTLNVYDTYGDGVEASIWGDYVDGYVSLNSNHIHNLYY
jgi:hypothetical protein